MAPLPSKNAGAIKTAAHSESLSSEPVREMTGKKGQKASPVEREEDEEEERL